MFTTNKKNLSVQLSFLPPSSLLEDARQNLKKQHLLKMLQQELLGNGN